MDSKTAFWFLEPLLKQLFLNPKFEPIAHCAQAESLTNKLLNHSLPVLSNLFSLYSSSFFFFLLFKMDEMDKREVFVRPQVHRSAKSGANSAIFELVT